LKFNVRSEAMRQPQPNVSLRVKRGNLVGENAILFTRLLHSVRNDIIKTLPISERVHLSPFPYLLGMDFIFYLSNGDAQNRALVRRWPGPLKINPKAERADRHLS